MLRYCNNMLHALFSWIQYPSHGNKHVSISCRKIGKNPTCNSLRVHPGKLPDQDGLGQSDLHRCGNNDCPVCNSGAADRQALALKGTIPIP